MKKYSILFYKCDGRSKVRVCECALIAGSELGVKTYFEEMCRRLNAVYCSTTFVDNVVLNLSV